LAMSERETGAEGGVLGALPSTPSGLDDPQPANAAVTTSVAIPP
jgi:hypothetical protein